MPEATDIMDEVMTRADLPIPPRIVQVAVRVRHMERAEAFYRDAIGMRLKFKYQPMPDVLEHFYGMSPGKDATMLCLVQRSGEAPQRPAAGMDAAMMLNIQVEDVAAVVARVEAAGGRVVRPTVTNAGGPFTIDMAFVEDPDGNTIELTHFY